jgi:AraC family transcriptional regulator
VTRADTFARFIDVLAETLDAPSPYAEQLHLSRFHVDRIISTVAGEPPAALRRRVLLERAAHRLLTTRDDVLEVALEAGYSSHEAFTRAFRRAYGEAPSLWRSSAARYQLDAPNGVHFHPPGGLRLRAERKVTQMELMTKMIEHHVWLLGEMVDIARALSDDVRNAPIQLSVEGIDDDPTILGLLSRLVGQLEMWVAAVNGQPYDFEAEKGRCLRTIAEHLAEAGPAFLAEVRAIVDQGRLDETFVDATCDPPETFTYGGMIAHVLTFGAARRTLVIGAFHTAGHTELGSGDPMRYVAEAA